MAEGQGVWSDPRRLLMEQVPSSFRIEASIR
jgi:hypothetical protein